MGGYVRGGGWLAMTIGWGWGQDLVDVSHEASRVRVVDRETQLLARDKLTRRDNSSEICEDTPLRFKQPTLLMNKRVHITQPAGMSWCFEEWKNRMIVLGGDTDSVFWRVGGMITWNPKQLIFSGCLVKTTISHIKIWNHPMETTIFLNGCFRFQDRIVMSSSCTSVKFKASIKTRKWKLLCQRPPPSVSNLLLYSRTSPIFFLLCASDVFFFRPKNHWTLRIWICIAGFWDLQTTSFEIPWFLGRAKFGF